MPLIQFVIILIVVGVLLWVVNTYIPMSRSIKGILNVVVVLVMIGFTLSPCAFILSISTKLMPSCGLPSFEVRTRQNMWLATWAPVVQILVPSIT